MSRPAHESKPSPTPRAEPLLSDLPIAKVPMSAPLRKLLLQLEEDPTRALRYRRRYVKNICRPYFDLCDAAALESDRIVLEQPKRVLDPARTAVQLAERSGDRHLVNESLGVLAHSHLAVEQRAEAGGVLEDYRGSALGCCRSCQADWWRRRGDYLVEMRDGAGADEALNRCLRAAEGVDVAGRVDFVRGISHHYLGHRDAALEAELRVLDNLSLTSPRGYFLDALAILAIFLRDATPEHDRRVLHCLGKFRQRIRAVRGWTVVRVRLRWVEGQILARLGEIDLAIRRLDSVRRYLFEHGPPRQAVAVTLDLAQIYCRHDYGDNYRTARTLLNTCKGRLAVQATGDEAVLRTGLEGALEVMGTNPEGEGMDVLVACRSSIVVPVPGMGLGREGGSAWICTAPN